MRKVFFIALIFSATTLIAQEPTNTSTSLRDSILSISEPDSMLNKVIKSIDSFTFCSVKYKISRDCNKINQSNCCSADLNPHNLQLGCYNGTSLFWTYFKAEWIARQNFESIPAQWMQQMKKLISEPVNCLLVNQKVLANKISCVTKEGHKHYCIITYGTINGQPVLVQLVSSKEIKKNKDIQNVFQQIIKFSE
jgi:hypothetical protein